MAHLFQRSYADNAEALMGERLRAEIRLRHSRHLDVVTGYLATSAWGVLGEALGDLERFRLLIGKDFELVGRSKSDTEDDIARLVKAALKSDSDPDRLPTPADADEVQGFISFLEREGVDVKLWRGHGFLHAKAYILDASAGVGSANFTANGLCHNRELVTWRQDDQAVRELQEWFDRYWADPTSVDYAAELIAVLRATRFGGELYTPFELLIRTLAERYGLDRPPSLEGASFSLKWFQEDAVFRLIKLLDAPAGGALLADAVGLGKTFMALGVIHHHLHRRRRQVRGRPVLLLTPASIAPMWERELAAYNLDWAVNIVRIQHLRHGFDFSPYLGADLVVVDEAHRLRGRGTWFQQVMDLLARCDPSTRVLLLTATPVNTSLDDLTTLLRVLTKNRRNAWAPDIPDFERYLERVDKGQLDPFPILDRAVVRRSRSDILAAQEERRAAGQLIEPLKLPDRRLGHEEYRYAPERDDLFDRFADALARLHLVPYDLDRYRLSPAGPASGPSSLAGLVMSGLLKRFESSVRAIAISLKRLDQTLDAFGAGLSQEPPRVLALDTPAVRRLVRQETAGDDDEEGTAGWDEILSDAPVLQDPGGYDLDAAASDLQQDRLRVRDLLKALPAESEDGKVAALIDLLTRPMAGPKIGLGGRRALVFSQFRDTATYLKERLDVAGVGPTALLHGGSSSAERASVAATFDPSRFGGGGGGLLGDEPRILVSTDVLAEGHNLQLAQAVVNFDLHWNPQVAVQRSGRVDRLNSPHDIVYLLSFLPEEGLDRHLGLIDALNKRFNLYKLLGLGDEPVTRLAAEQKAGTTLEQLRRLYRDDSGVLDDIEQAFTLGSTDYMRQPLELFLARKTKEALAGIPVGVQSCKQVPTGWPHGAGVFVALSFGPSGNAETFWRFYQRKGDGWGEAIVDDAAIFRGIVCQEREPRRDPPPWVDPAATVALDWALLRRAATEVADALTLRRATAAVTKGASDRSARLRAELVSLAGSDSIEGIEELLDRLEEVRIEDYDARPGYRGLEDARRRARSADTAAERHAALVELVKRGNELVGPVEVKEHSEAVEVTPDQLRLVAWENLVARPSVPLTDQLAL